MTNQISPDFAEVSQSPFERIKRVDDEDNDFWSAHDLMPLLEYASWQKFKSVLLKSQIACENSGHDPNDHFIRAVKMVPIGSDAKREQEMRYKGDKTRYVLTRNGEQPLERGYYYCPDCGSGLFPPG
ncbi:MAG: hypothetical protein ACYDBJ_14725 [Aggregatilineales bacterium]